MGPTSSLKELVEVVNQQLGVLAKPLTRTLTFVFVMAAIIGGLTFIGFCVAWWIPSLRALLDGPAASRSEWIAIAGVGLALIVAAWALARRITRVIQQAVLLERALAEHKATALTED